MQFFSVGIKTSKLQYDRLDNHIGRPKRTLTAKKRKVYGVLECVIVINVHQDDHVCTLGSIRNHFVPLG